MPLPKSYVYALFAAALSLAACGKQDAPAPAPAAAKPAATPAAEPQPEPEETSDDAAAPADPIAEKAAAMLERAQNALASEAELNAYRSAQEKLAADDLTHTQTLTAANGQTIQIRFGSAGDKHTVQLKRGKLDALLEQLADTPGALTYDDGGGLTLVVRGEKVPVVIEQNGERIAYE